MSRRSLPLSLLAALWLVGAASAQAPRGPGRIAVGGTMPTGYVGCLARFGLTRDLLLDAQLADPKVLARYDLVIVAGASSPLVAQALLKYLDQGGRVLFDYSAGSSKARLDTGTMLFGTTAVGRGLVRPTTGSPLRADADVDGSLFPVRAGYAPDPAGLTDPQVLAEFSATVAKGTLAKDTARQAVKRPLTELLATGPAAPSILIGGKGKGRLLLCGVPVGLYTGLSGYDGDALILGLVRILSDGRAVPQLTPEGPHLGRKKSPRSLKKGGETPAAAAPVEDEDAPTDRPAGPGERGPLPQGFTSLEAEPGDEFNLTARTGHGSADVLLHYWNVSNFLRVSVGPNGVRVRRRSEGVDTDLETRRGSVAPGETLRLKERCDTLSLQLGRLYLTVDTSHLHRGALAGARLVEPEYRPMEAVYFADDFMRTDEQRGPWRTVGGTWRTVPVQNPDMGANPFSYKVDAGNGLAVASAGESFWDEYKFTCAVRPGDKPMPGQSVGLGWYAADADNGYVFEAAVTAKPEAVPDGLRLVKLVGGRREVLASAPGCACGGQWYRFMVKSAGPWLGVFIDGVKVLGAQDTTYTGGGVGLRAERGEARFDDVVVEAGVLATAQGARIRGKVPDYAGLIDVDSWAGPATPWEADPERGGLFWRRNALFGDLDLRFDHALPPDGSTLNLMVEADGEKVDSGWRLELARRGRLGQVALLHLGTVVGRAEVPLAGERLTLLLTRRSVGALVQLAVTVDGRRLLESKAPAGGAGGRLAFATTGFKPKVGGLSLWALNLRDYTFDAAPVDWWVGGGTWDLTNRWSCTPDWSWFGGFAEGVAAIWNKQSFAGDLVMDYYAGPKMLNAKTAGWDPRKARELMGELNAVLCGDGVSVTSGYSFLVGTSDGTKVGTGARLLRRGQVVATNPDFRFFGRVHNRWANIRVEKHAGHLALFVDGQSVLSYTDPQPLDSGYAGIWTRDNGIMIPRVTIAFQALGARLLSLAGA